MKAAAKAAWEKAESHPAWSEIEDAIKEYQQMVATIERLKDEIEQLRLHEARLKWLHDCSTGQTDTEGYEWGIYRVKWVDGKAVSVLQTNSDLSDLDAEIARELNTPNDQAQARPPTATLERKGDDQ
jgi:hypothetical protein